MKIGILQTGRSPDELKSVHGDYDQVCAGLFEGYGLTFETWPVLDNVFPPSPSAADGWLITGSRHGVYEDHEWLAPLENFIRETYEQQIPQVGICFGHQIVAQALGGKVVKHDAGWIVGQQDYRVDTGNGAAKDMTLLAWHQDQVVSLPQNATSFASGENCKFAAIEYGDRALTVQAHPEFSPDFVKDLFAARADVLPPEVLAKRDDDVSGPHDAAYFAERMANLLRKEAQKE